MAPDDLTTGGLNLEQLLGQSLFGWLHVSWGSGAALTLFAVDVEFVGDCNILSVNKQRVLQDPPASTDPDQECSPFFI